MYPDIISPSFREPCFMLYYAMGINGILRYHKHLSFYIGSKAADFDSVVLNEAKAYQHDNGKWTEAMKIAVRTHEIFVRPVSQKWKKK